MNDSPGANVEFRRNKVSSNTASHVSPALRLSKHVLGLVRQANSIHVRCMWGTCLLNNFHLLPITMFVLPRALALLTSLAQLVYARFRMAQLLPS